MKDKLIFYSACFALGCRLPPFTTPTYWLGAVAFGVALEFYRRL